MLNRPFGLLTVVTVLSLVQSAAGIDTDHDSMIKKMDRAVSPGIRHSLEEAGREIEDLPAAEKHLYDRAGGDR